MSGPELITAAEKGRSPWADAWRRLCRNHLAVAGGLYVVLLALASCLPWLLGLSIEAQGLDVVSAPPGTRMIKIYVPGQRDPVQYTDAAHFASTPDYVAGPAADSALAALTAGRTATFAGKTYRPSRFWLGADVLGRDLRAFFLGPEDRCWWGWWRPWSPWWWA
jgi:oligopeptide transport system permease protein